MQQYTPVTEPTIVRRVHIAITNGQTWIIDHGEPYPPNATEDNGVYVQGYSLKLRLPWAEDYYDDRHLHFSVGLSDSLNTMAAINFYAQLVKQSVMC